MSSERERERGWGADEMDEAGAEWSARGADPEGGMGVNGDPEGGSADPEGGANAYDDPEGGGNEYDEADTTLVAPLLGVGGPKITATAPTPLASPGRAHVEFGDPEGAGGSPYVRAASPAMQTASPAMSAASAAYPAMSAGARTASRANSVSSTNDSPFGHRVSPSVSKRPAPVVVEPLPAVGKYVVDTQPYTPMYGASPYSDVQVSLSG
jgi:hypothetical protein